MKRWERNVETRCEKGRGRNEAEGRDWVRWKIQRREKNTKERGRGGKSKEGRDKVRWKSKRRGRGDRKHERGIEEEREGRRKGGREGNPPIDLSKFLMLRYLCAFVSFSFMNPFLIALLLYLPFSSVLYKLGLSPPLFNQGLVIRNLLLYAFLWNFTGLMVFVWPFVSLLGPL